MSSAIKTLSKYIKYLYFINAMLFWSIVVSIFMNPLLLILLLPLFAGTIWLIRETNKYIDADYKAWKDEFSESHTFLHKWINPDSECIDINYWRNNDSLEIVKQVAGQKKLIK